MTKKNYIAIAKIISEVKDVDTRAQLALDLGLYFSKENPRFKIQQFVGACEPPNN